MTGRGGGRGKVLLPPINFIFKLLQQHSTVSIWLYEQLAIRIEGKIRTCGLLRIRADGLSSQGFDEFMNLVIDDAVEVKQATKTEEERRRPLG
ncbi:mRNA splicing protein sme1 [Trapelia coarctata]|nr:mRNA splicing protein sme1 [Trapelia coarctata]